MKVVWSPLVIEDKDCIIGYVDSDWNINLCYFLIVDQKYPALVEIEVLFHEFFHWLIRNPTFGKFWDKLWKPIIRSYL